MKTTPRNAPARNALKVRTAVKAGLLCTNENITSLGYRARDYLGTQMEGTGI